MSRARARTLPKLFGFLVVLSMAASASAADVPDAAEPTPAELEAAEKRRVPWHDTLFVWDNSATTETIGIGRETQSRNPTYEMTFRLAPRYYLLDDEKRSLSVRADARLLREFTDSDTTTDRGEWTFADTELWLAWIERLRDVPGERTDFILRAPSLVLPTSEIGAATGKLLGVGVGVGIDQGVPLRGEASGFLISTTLRPRAGYQYNFTSDNVPTSDRIGRVRLDPSGRSLPSDQLSGSAFGQHQVTLNFRAETLLAKALTLTTEVGAIYAYKYALADRVSLCGVIDTGCVDIGANPDETRSGVATVFGVELGYEISDAVSGSIGYANLSGQLGARGQRRNVFYSPDARASASLTFALDAVYRAAR